MESMPPGQRSEVLKQMAKSRGPWDACQRAGLLRNCFRALSTCAADRGCASGLGASAWLPKDFLASSVALALLETRAGFPETGGSAAMGPGAGSGHPASAGASGASAGRSGGGGGGGAGGGGGGHQASAPASSRAAAGELGPILEGLSFDVAALGLSALRGATEGYAQEVKRIRGEIAQMLAALGMLIADTSPSGRHPRPSLHGTLVDVRDAFNDPETGLDRYLALDEKRLEQGVSCLSKVQADMVGGRPVEAGWAQRCIRETADAMVIRPQRGEGLRAVSDRLAEGKQELLKMADTAERRIQLKPLLDAFDALIQAARGSEREFKDSDAAPWSFIRNPRQVREGLNREIKRRHRELLEWTGRHERHALSMRDVLFALGRAKSEFGRLAALGTADEMIGYLAAGTESTVAAVYALRSIRSSLSS
ncbi:MAG: hypothetical protein HY553_23185 [Elusimicrobia bacterium]|nr:hypothetical protein [Elusimicrobiota bacterium]